MSSQPVRYPVTQEVRETFKLHVQEWAEKLVPGWRVGVSDIPHKRYAAEVVKFDTSSMLASIKLGTDLGGTRMTEENIEALAFHEVCHIFLHRYGESMADPHASQEAKNAAEHEVIHILTKLFVPGSNL